MKKHLLVTMLFLSFFVVSCGKVATYDVDEKTNTVSVKDVYNYYKPQIEKDPNSFLQIALNVDYVRDSAFQYLITKELAKNYIESGINEELTDTYNTALEGQKDRIETEFYIEKMQEDFLNAFDKEKHSFAKVSHVQMANTPENKAILEDALKTIAAEEPDAQKAAFEGVAYDKSEDKYTQFMGGSLGYISDGDFGSEFDKVIFTDKQDKGLVNQVVESKEAIHLVYIEEPAKAISLKKLEKDLPKLQYQILKSRILLNIQDQMKEENTVSYLTADDKGNVFLNGSSVDLNTLSKDTPIFKVYDQDITLETVETGLTSSLSDIYKNAKDQFSNILSYLLDVQFVKGYAVANGYDTNASYKKEIQANLDEYLENFTIQVFYSFFSKEYKDQITDAQLQDMYNETKDRLINPQTGEQLSFDQVKPQLEMMMVQQLLLGFIDSLKEQYNVVFDDKGIAKLQDKFSKTATSMLDKKAKENPVPEMPEAEASNEEVNE